MTGKLIPGADGATWTEGRTPGSVTVFLPTVDGHGMRDGFRVLGDFSYADGDIEPCISDRVGDIRRHQSFQAALAWCGLPRRSMFDDVSGAIAAFLTQRLNPLNVVDPAAAVIAAVIAVAAEIGSGTARSDSELLRDVILPAARQLVRQPVGAR